MEKPQEMEAILIHYIFDTWALSDSVRYFYTIFY